jgi:hypothetical protein
MVLKLVMAAARTWRRLKGDNRLPKVIEGGTVETASGSSLPAPRTPPDQAVTQLPA